MNGVKGVRFQGDQPQVPPTQYNPALLGSVASPGQRGSQITPIPATEVGQLFMTRTVGFDFMGMVGPADRGMSKASTGYLRVVLDTGSWPFNYIRRDVQERLGLAVIPHKTTGLLIDGSTFDSRGFVNTIVTLPDGKPIEVAFAILDNLPVDVVIGRGDMMKFDLFGFLLDQSAGGDVMACGAFGDRDEEGVESEGSGDLSEEGECAYQEHVACSEEQFKKIPLRYAAMVEDFKEVFGPLDKRPAKLGQMDLKLMASPSNPLSNRKTRPRHFNKLDGEEIEKQVQDLLAKGIIVECNSDFASQVLLIRKKDGSFRFCIDYRFLNAITEGLKWPLPRTTDMIQRLKSKRWFSKFDLHKAYHQVALTEEAS